MTNEGTWEKTAAVCRSRMDKMTSLLVALASCWVLGDAAVTTEGQLYDNIGLDNKMFTEEIKFESPARDEMECGWLCSRHDSCLTFTFHQNTCRGHGVPMTLCSDSTPAAGARSFSRKKVETVVKRLTNTSLGLDLDVAYDDDWLVFQKRYDGSEEFYRNWQDYEHGFGDVYGEYWLGLDPLYRITTSGESYELRVQLWKWDGTCVSARYSGFSVGTAVEKYKLNYDSFLGGDAKDGLWFQKGMMFTTLDADNDMRSNANCAQVFHGAWWYKGCHISNLNGRYEPMEVVDPESLTWKTVFADPFTSLKGSQMMIKPEN